MGEGARGCMTLARFFVSCAVVVGGSLVLCALSSPDLLQVSPHVEAFARFARQQSRLLFAYKRSRTKALPEVAQVNPPCYVLAHTTLDPGNAPFRQAQA